MIREDRELLAELARLNTAMAPLAMRMMGGTVSTAEQKNYVQRLVVAGERLRRRADETAGAVVAGEVLVNEPLILPWRFWYRRPRCTVRMSLDFAMRQPLHWVWWQLSHSTGPEVSLEDQPPAS